MSDNITPRFGLHLGGDAEQDRDLTMAARKALEDAQEFGLDAVLVELRRYEAELDARIEVIEGQRKVWRETWG